MSNSKNSNQPMNSMGSFGYRTDPANSLTPVKPSGTSYPALPMYEPKPMKTNEVQKPKTL